MIDEEQTERYVKAKVVHVNGFNVQSSLVNKPVNSQMSLAQQYVGRHTLEFC